MTEPMGDHPDLAVPLTPDAAGGLSFQSYAAQPRIGDVRVHPLRKHRAENGWFAELLRLEGGAVESLPGEDPMVLRQLSASHAAPGRINAFHVHPRRGQNELWTVVQGQLLVWLVDCRRDSPTAGVRQAVLLSAEEPAWLYVPAGVAHGYRSGPEGALLVYAMDRQFDPTDPDEGRLSWDHFGPELWADDRG